jgi:Rps23 Pro-64 3,4-dihydroxylase Tpa1-like proline 4-hydroxylase
LSFPIGWNIDSFMANFSPTLSSGLDRKALRQDYQEHGHVQITDFLDTVSGAEFERVLSGSSDWVQMLNSGEKVFELSRDIRSGFSSDRAAALQAAVDEGARWGFQFRYEAIRVSDDAALRTVAAGPLDLFLSFLCSAEVLALMREITADDSITFADAQATRYTAGDFLTGHNDNVAGKNRIAAYVYGLTPIWRPEWGGLLLFHESASRVKGFIPSFNTLNLFRVPQPHSVSMVTNFAAAPRLSVTGWLRAKTP